MSTLKTNRIEPVGSTAGTVTVDGTMVFTQGATFPGGISVGQNAYFSGGVTFNAGASSAAVISCATAPTQGQHLANKTYVDGQAIGVGQTWQDVKLSRAANTVYTNTTGRPIMVSITCGSSQRLDPILVGGVDIGNIVSISTTTSCFSFIVPNNTTYQCGGAGDNFIQWCELR